MKEQQQVVSTNPTDRAKAEEVAKEVALSNHTYPTLINAITEALLPLLEQNRELREALEPFADRYNRAAKIEPLAHEMKRLDAERRAAALLSRQPDRKERE